MIKQSPFSEVVIFHRNGRRTWHCKVHSIDPKHQKNSQDVFFHILVQIENKPSITNCRMELDRWSGGASARFKINDTTAILASSEYLRFITHDIEITSTQSKNTFRSFSELPIVNMPNAQLRCHLRSPMTLPSQYDKLSHLGLFTISSF